jgi:hypothetical protein
VETNYKEFKSAIKLKIDSLGVLLGKGAVGEGSGSLDIFLKKTMPYGSWRGRWRHSGGDALSEHQPLQDCH